MPAIQLITHRGRAVAVIVNEQAIIAQHLRGAERRHVQAMCLYALQIAAGERVGPYRNQDAERYARHGWL